MRSIAPLLAAVAGMFLVPGVAAAGQETYEVSDSWTLTYVDGTPTIVPQAEDDVLEVICHNEEQMTDWHVNDEELVADFRERTDGTGIQVRPEFTGETETIEITVVCERG
jgi:hypothetical protein